MYIERRRNTLSKNAGTEVKICLVKNGCELLFDERNLSDGCK